MSKARNRPPRLEPRVVPPPVPAPAPTLGELLERSHVAGRAVATGPSELRRLVERAAGGRAAPDPLDRAWKVVREVFGATPEAPLIDPELTIRAARRAVSRIAEVAGTGANIAFATSRPASLITVYLALARMARISGGTVDDDDDSSPLRVDGRADRELRWVDGVAMVTDGESLCSTRGPEAAREWVFLAPRPALVVADGPYADAALAAGIEVIAFAGIDHCSLAVERSGCCTVVPMWTDRPPAAYRPLLEHALGAAVEPSAADGSAPSGPAHAG